jgi:uncharacterized protein
MKLLNYTRGCLVAERLNVAGNFFSRLKGLLGRKSFERGEALLIPKCKGIHTIGMKFAIDVIFLDKDFRVLRAFGRIPPNKTGPVEMDASSVVELPAGTLNLLGISVGDAFQLAD